MVSFFCFFFKIVSQPFYKKSTLYIKELDCDKRKPNK